MSKTNKQTAATSASTDKLESDKAFLERNNVKLIMNNLLDSLLYNKPNDPIDFICE
jgi:hypothetical protein